MSRITPHFVKLMARMGGTADPRVLETIAQLCEALTEQHSCLELNRLADHDAIIATLEKTKLVSRGTEPAPLVLDGDRLYLQRYFRFEQTIAGRLAEMNEPLADIDDASVRRALEAHFPTASMQRLAAFQALTRRLTVIAGGPGTGKTTTVSGMLRALQELAGKNPPTIALAAPTGKAAMKLSEGLAGIDAAGEVKTLHRLLGFRPRTGDYRYSADNPLPADLVIVDEVSMVDLAMMARLLSALKPDARLILLGDPGQLPSVEAGNLLADICKHGYPFSAAYAERAAGVTGVTVTGEAPRHRLQDALCRLTESHRFSPDKGIGRLARSVQQGEIDLNQQDEVSSEPVASLTPARLAALYQDYIDAIATRGDAGRLTECFSSVRLLTPLKDGDEGVHAINARMEDLLFGRGLIGEDRSFYHGRPVLITRNDYNLQLFNGDIGICIHRPDGERRVVFAAGESLREFLPSRLPEHETCFAMTVHKSQGSEFDHVAIMVPAPATPQQTRLLTREMLYTAVTRARSRLTLYFDQAALATCLAQTTVRQSGLGDRLRDDTG